MKHFRTKWRIVKDNYAGYEVQIKRWWLPFWYQKDYSNSFSTVESAEQFALLDRNEVVKTGVIEKGDQSGEAAVK